MLKSKSHFKRIHGSQITIIALEQRSANWVFEATCGRYEEQAAGRRPQKLNDMRSVNRQMRCNGSGIFSNKDKTVGI
jgi:hypothetical protein